MSDCPATPERIDQCPATPDRLLNVKSPESTDSEDQQETRNQNREDSSSPPPNCAICLGRCKNKCFTDSCLHQFCFKCLLEWSKVKAECPLCKQSFKSIIHNVKSIDQFEEYLVQPQPTVPVPLPIVYGNQRLTQRNHHHHYHHYHHHNSAVAAAAQRSNSNGQQFFAHRFDVFINDLPRYRNGFSTTFQVHSPENDAFQQLYLHRTSLSDRFRQQYPDDLIASGSIALLWRQYIYDRRLYALPVVDITGRYRECSARFYRNNPAQVHRLMPWLARDLVCLLRDTEHHVTLVSHNINQLITVYNINSVAFRKRCTVYFGSRTSHFIHELLTFARSPYDMIGYDRQARYAPFEEIIISSSSSNTSSASEHEGDGSNEPSATRSSRRRNQQSNSVTATAAATELHNSSDNNRLATASRAPILVTVALDTGTDGPNNSGNATSTSIVTPLIEILDGTSILTQHLTNNNHTESVVIGPTTSSQNYQPSTSANGNTENILSPDSTSDECEFVMEQKPPHLRTPELVSLNSESDSDVMFVSETRDYISPTTAPAPATATTTTTTTATTTILRRPKRRTTPHPRSSYNSYSSSLSSTDEEANGKFHHKSRMNLKVENNPQTVATISNTSRNSRSRSSSSKNECNYKASTSAGYSNSTSSSVGKYEWPGRRKYEVRRRLSMKELFGSSSSDDDNGNDRKTRSDRCKRNRSENKKRGYNSSDDQSSTEPFFSSESADTDDTSWSRNKNNVYVTYYKKQKLLRKRRPKKKSRKA